MGLLKRLSLFATAFVFLTFSTSTAYAQQRQARDRAVQEMDLILEIIETQALDSVDIAWCAQQIQKKGISGCLDKYSEYLTAEDRKNFLPAAYAGIGAKIQADGRFVVLFPFPGSPAAKAGILQGDTLVKVDTTILFFSDSVTPQDVEHVVAMVRGLENTTVNLSFVRGGIVTGPITIIRATIILNPVLAATIDSSLGYLSLANFNENAAEEMEKVLKSFKSAGIRKLILDFRSNPGGLLDQADLIADLFSPDSGNFKVTQHFRNRADIESITTARGPHADMKVILLVDEGSASAAEMVAGILQDWKVVTLVGTHTYGKGIGQTTFPLDTLPDTPYLKLTTFAFLVGNNKVKITPNAPLQPDIRVDDDLTPAEQAQRLAEFRKHNPNTPYLNPRLDKQLAKAIELLK